MPARRTVRIALVAAVALLASAGASAADLDVTIENVKSSEGSLLIAIYSTPEGYRNNALRTMKTPASTPTTTVRIDGLPPGDYAITLFHDRNDNAKLDSNLVGVPTEPYGFSNNPRNLMAPATWEQARIVIGTEGSRTAVKLSD